MNIFLVTLFLHLLLERSAEIENIFVNFESYFVKEKMECSTCSELEIEPMTFRTLLGCSNH